VQHGQFKPAATLLGWAQSYQTRIRFTLLPYQQAWLSDIQRGLEGWKSGERQATQNYGAQLDIEELRHFALEAIHVLD
jgi:hypothetical protein